MDNFLAILNEVWVNGLLGVSMTKIIASIAVLLLSFLLRGFVVTVVVSSIERLAKSTESSLDDEILKAVKILTAFRISSSSEDSVLFASLSIDDTTTVTTNPLRRKDSNKTAIEAIILVILTPRRPFTQTSFKIAKKLSIIDT